MRIIFLIIPFLFLTCTKATSQVTNDTINFDDNFSIYQDTIGFVNIKGTMTNALKYHDKFYVLFYNYSSRKMWLYIFSNGKIENIVDCPKIDTPIGLDFFVNNDSIIFNPHFIMEQENFFNIHSLTWEKRKRNETDGLVFEDEKFYVYNMGSAEWSTTWFIDKNTNRTYLVDAFAPLVNKIGSTYFLTNPFKIQKVDNPLKLKIDSPTNDVVIPKDRFDYDNWFKKPRFISSFIWQNELLHIYETPTTTYIAKFENDSIIPVQVVGENMNFYPWNSYFRRNLKPNSDLLMFRVKNERSRVGFIEIIDNKILMHYILNEEEFTY